MWKPMNSVAPSAGVKEYLRVVKQIWLPALASSVVIVVVAVGIFLGLAFGLESVHDYALPISTLLFVGITAVAWLLARRTEQA